MSNFEDDEALFDDIYAGDQPTTVDTAPSNVTEKESSDAQQSSNHTIEPETAADNNSNEAAASTIPESESTNQSGSLQPYNNLPAADSNSNNTSEQPQQSSVANVNGQGQIPGQPDYTAAFQQLQQFQMMQQQQQQQQQQGQGQMPMHGMPQMSQFQQYQQYQQNQNQNQNQNHDQNQNQDRSQEQTNEHIPDITEVEVPTNFKDTVKADLSNKDVGKLFIGGLNWETDEDRLKQYFGKYGEVLETNVMRDSSTGKSRGFAFLTFAASNSVDAVLREKHILDGKLIDPKRAIPKDEQEKVGKVFVGGIAADVTPEEFRNYFEKFGTIIDSQLMINKDTGKSRGYGFVTYDSAEAVDRVTRNNYVMFHGKKMEIKKAEPRTQHLRNQGKTADGSSPMGGNPMGGMNNNGYMMNGYGDMSQYWQQMQQMQQMQQYWMQMQQQQQQQQQMQQMSPNSQEAQINMYQMGNDSNNNNDDDGVPNPQERGNSRRDDDEDSRNIPNLPSGPKKFREKGSGDRDRERERDRDRGNGSGNGNGNGNGNGSGNGNGNGGSRFNERRSGGGGGGRRSGKYRSGRRNNYHPYRR